MGDVIGKYLETEGVGGSGSDHGDVIGEYIWNADIG